ncbi:hypothetical protein [Azohydromonas sediminis]|uniref:hypothetical protein n=1 Tax=Azohydromonas sediminis TaxID=2259674 RepID=UPI003012E3EB
MAAPRRAVFRPSAASVPSFIVRPSRLPHAAGMAMQGAVPGDGIRARWPRRRLRAGGGGSGWTSVQSSDYWSGTAYAPSPSVDAWNFDTNDGNQNNDDQSNQNYAVAVRPGG